MAYGNIIAGEQTGYFSFDPGNASVKTKICEVFTGAYDPTAVAFAGEYYNNVLHTFSAAPNSWSVWAQMTYAPRNPLTGEIVSGGGMAWPYAPGKIVNDLAYDHSDSAMYAIYGGNELHTVAAREFTKVNAITGMAGNPLTLAVDLEGNMYSISDGADAKLYSINKATGVATEIGSTGKPARGFQSMNYNHFDGTLYWCQADTLTDGTLNTAFMTVNTATGAATELQANVGRITCFYIPYRADHAVPAQVSELVLLPADPASAGGGLSATLRWINPHLTSEGDPLGSLTAVMVYDSLGTTLLHTITDAQMGETGQWEFTVETAGTYSYNVVAQNSVGAGSMAFVSGIIGTPDVAPGAPTHVTFTKDDNAKTATLAWNAPLVGINGGWIDASTLTYSVKRITNAFDPDTLQIATGLTATTFTDEFMVNGEKDEEASNYRYLVTASNSLGTGGTAATDMQTVGMPFTVPYSMGFERIYENGVVVSKENFGAWKANNLSESPYLSKGWTYQNFHGTVVPTGSGHNSTWGVMVSSSEEKNDYLFTPKIAMEAGKGYVLKFWAKPIVAGWTEKLAVYLTTEQDWRSITGQPIFKKENIDHNGYLQYEAFITGQAAGNYSLAFHSYGNLGMVFYLDDVTVTEVLNNDAQMLDLIGTAVPMVGAPFTYKALVKNNGALPLSGYTVKLHDGTNAVVATGSEAPTLAPGESRWISLAFTPAAEGAASLYAVIEAEADENTGNNTSETMQVTVQATGATYTGAVGKGATEKAYIPFCFYSYSSVVQTIYFDHELMGQGGSITELQYFSDFATQAGVTGHGLQIWLANTERTGFDGAIKDWFPQSDFTKVFEGNITFPAGLNTITITLDEAFEYTGQNLVIMAVRPMEKVYYDPQDAFINSNDLHFAQRSRIYNSGTIEFDWTQSGLVTSSYPNIGVKISIANGSVHGTVTDNEGNPAEGATVNIVGENATRTTNAAGEYSFGALVPGSYKFVASKHGFLNSDESAEITVAANTATEVNLQLKHIDAYTVSGKITGNDAPDGVADVRVTLSGYETFTTVTDAQGNYSIPDVYGGHKYKVEAKRVGYITSTDSITVTASVTHSVELMAKAYPVVNPLVADRESEAFVSWSAPVAADYETLAFDDGSYEYGLGFIPGYAQYAGNRFMPGNKGTITSVDIYGIAAPNNTDKPLTVEVYDSVRTKIGSSEPFIMPADAWINIPLNNIEYEGEFYVMVYWGTADGYSNYIGSDENGPNIDRQMGWVSDGTIWSLYSNITGKKNVFMLRANVTVPEVDDTSKAPLNTQTKYWFGASAEMETVMLSSVNKAPAGVPAPSNLIAVYPKDALAAAWASAGASASAPVLRFDGMSAVSGLSVETAPPAVLPNKAVPAPAPLEYQVYRLLEGSAETAWTLLGTVPALTREYTDAAWATQPAGVYQYAVKAVYTNNNVSAPRLTNILLKDMYFTVNVNVTANSSDSADGAVVTLTHHDGNPEHVYTGTVSEGKAAFTGVWRGNYDILVTLAGFENFGATGIAVEAALEYPVELIEIKKPPFNLEVEPTDNPANWTFSWNNLFAAQRIAYWSEDYTKLNALTQAANMGYGVLFDLESYPVAAIDTFEFYHTPVVAGQSGIYDYKLHVVDMTAGIEIYESSTLQTTGNDKWEKFVLNGDNFGGKKVAVYIEPLSAIQYNATTDVYHPVLCADGITTNAHSYMFNMSTGQVSLIGAQGATFGEYLANLWIDINGEKVNVAAGAKAFTAYEVYLNGESKGTTTDTRYEFTALAAGTYTAGVKSVYTSGDSETQEVEFTVGATVTYEQPEHGTLEVTAGGSPIASGSMVAIGTELVITATPDEGYESGSLKVNGDDFISGGTHTVTADVVIEASFTVSGISGNTLTGITVYGNKNNVHIVNNSGIVLKSVQIADVLGRVVYSGKAGSSVTIPVNGASGIYLVKLVSEDSKVLSTKVYLN
jgi:hypothetical protein